MPERPPQGVPDTLGSAAEEAGEPRPEHARSQVPFIPDACKGVASPPKKEAIVPVLRLNDGEKLLWKDSISLVEKRLVSRIGICYLTNQRIVVDTQSLIRGLAGAFSALARALLLNSKQFGTQRKEISLRKMTRISFSKYGLNQALIIPLGDGTEIRLVMGPKQRRQWLAAFDQALQAQRLERVPYGEETWRVRPVPF